jgi:hypothetical protein
MNYIKIITIVIFAGLISISFRSETSIIDHPVIEDAYYTFSVAKNIANGHGISADGENLTNGFQPLYTFLIVPAFVLTNNDYLSIRIIFILMLLVLFLSAYLFGLIIRDSLLAILGIGSQELFWIAFFIYLSSLLLIINYLNGLETGLLLLCVLSFIRYYQKLQEFNLKNIPVLGIILGLLVLIRIDAVFFVIIFSISLIFHKDIRIKTRIIYAIILSFISLLISSPWWIYNYTVFNSIMPTSGQAQFEFGIFYYRLFYLSDAWTQNLSPFTYTFDRFLHGWSGVIIRLMIIGTLTFYINKQLTGKFKNLFKSNTIAKRTYQIILVIAIYTIVLSIWYFFFSSAGHFYLRYIVIMSIIGQFVFVIFIAIIFKKFKRIFYLIPTALALIILAVVLLFHTELMLNKSQFFKYQLQLVKKYVPEKEYVAAGQSGTLGFFRQRVVNLDGKVNNEALIYKDRIVKYLDKKKIHWICDWKFFIDDYLGDNPEKIGWIQVGKYGEFYLYHKSTE